MKYNRKNRERYRWLSTVRVDRAWDTWWGWFAVVEDDDFLYLLDLYDYD